MTYEDFHILDACYWDFRSLAKTKHFSKEEAGPNLLEEIAFIWLIAVEVTNMLLGRCDWHIMARADGLTSRFVCVPRDVWVHFEITDWIKGVARSATGDTLYSVHLAQAEGYALCTDPESFKIAHPDAYMVGGELVHNLSLYSLRTAPDHPQDVNWSAIPCEKSQADQQVIEQEKVILPLQEEVKPVGSAAAEKACTVDLEKQMRASPDKPKPKEACWRDAVARFPRLSRKAFDRAWAKAIESSGSFNWRRPGPRKPL